MKSKVLWLALFALIGSVAYTGCAPDGLGTPPATPADWGFKAPTTAQTTQGKEKTWQDTWDTLVREAKKEGRVSIYRGATPMNRALERFRQKYGIEATSLTGTPGEMVERLARENRARANSADIHITGYGGLRLAKPQGLLLPLSDLIVLPEVRDPGKWFGGKFPMIDDSQVDFLGRVSSSLWRNTDLVREGEIREYRDLLQPKWKGQIILDDPQGSGAGTQWFRMYYPLLGDDFMKTFIGQEPMITRDRRLEVEWLARGKYSLLIGGNYDNLLDFRKAGEPIELVETKEGEYIGPGGGCIQVLKEAPHPNAARVFLNWMLSQEGQTLISEETLIPSLRVDVPTGHLDPRTVPKAGRVYLADTLETLEKANEFMAQSGRIFAPLLK
ncbi:MAG: extracellular solute-binding protein [Chloroflexi bacterium]|nr:extracellular solute-binding protein [Chloroflexota bacterium]